MRIVLDVQGFITADKRFTPKELATYDGATISHHVFKPPFPFDRLPSKFQQQAVWLMNNHHCIPWSEGFTPTHHFADILNRLLKNADFVYVKGREKAEFIRHYTNKPVIEIEEHPALTPTKAACMSHSKSVCYCALSNVYYLYRFYIME